MSNLSVPCSAVVRVRIVAPATHRCPFRDELDQGEVRIEWTTSLGETLELHALAGLIAARADEEISHEQWTADLAEQVAAAAVVDGLCVTSEWQTAGLRVSVESGSTLKSGPSDG